MGALQARMYRDEKDRQVFMQHLLKDIRALELMMERGMIETSPMRIGAEQEMCFVDKHWRPALVIREVLDELDDDHFTTEYTRFNMEANMKPLVFEGNCLSQMERDLQALMDKAYQAAAKLDAKIVLTGILPTIRRRNLIEEERFLGMSNEALEKARRPLRYKYLTEALKKQRGSMFEFRISGMDELITKHASAVFEGCNTSFQVHYQTHPDDFLAAYNWAQAITGPVMAATTNSPLLFGKRLWRETRIALFQQSVDTRNSANLHRVTDPRVAFGTKWETGSIVDMYKENIARHRILLIADIEEDSLKILNEGGVPSLSALQIHNGCIYKWNRACYGVGGGKPHFRIENRILPAGPTIKDEIANAAFWLGLMKGMPDMYRNIHELMDFDHVKMNFNKAARLGLGASFTWIDEEGKRIFPSARKLILTILLPIAKAGLQKAKVDEQDIEEYLGIIEKRVSSQFTGGQWILDSYMKLAKEGTNDEALVATTAGMYKRQIAGKPVHEWEEDLAQMAEAGTWLNRYQHISQIMNTDLFTVTESDLIEFVSNIMSWRKIHHLPVENEKGELVGLISSANLVERFCSAGSESSEVLTAKDIMMTKPLTVTPETETGKALALMKANKVGCLPVVNNRKQNKLIGIVTDRDLINVSVHLFDELQQYYASGNNNETQETED